MSLAGKVIESGKYLCT